MLDRGLAHKKSRGPFQDLVQKNGRLADAPTLSIRYNTLITGPPHTHSERGFHVTFLFSPSLGWGARSPSNPTQGPEPLHPESR